MNRKSPSWLKFAVDGKILFVFAKSKVPKYAFKMAQYKGIDLEQATKEERKPFLGLSFFREEQLNQ